MQIMSTRKFRVQQDIEHFWGSPTWTGVGFLPNSETLFSYDLQNLMLFTSTIHSCKIIIKVDSCVWKKDQFPSVDFLNNQQPLTSLENFVLPKPALKHDIMPYHNTSDHYQKILVAIISYLIIIIADIYFILNNRFFFAMPLQADINVAQQCTDAGLTTAICLSLLLEECCSASHHHTNF